MDRFVSPSVPAEKARSAPRRIGWAALSALAAACAGIACVAPERVEASGQPTLSADPSLIARWDDALRSIGRTPVTPPTEDIVVGDVFAFGEEPKPGSSFDSLARAAPRWSSVAGTTSEEADGDTRRLVRPPFGSGEREGGPGEGRPRSRRLVHLGLVEDLTFDSDDLRAFVPAELGALFASRDGDAGYEVSVELIDGWADSLAVASAVESVLEPRPSGYGVQLSPDARRNLALTSSPSNGRSFVSIVTETLSTSCLEILIRTKGSASPGPERRDRLSVEPDVAEEFDPGLEALERAQAINRALAESGIEDRMDGRLEFLAVTDEAVSVRRTWSHPLVVAVRGLTLDVDLATGAVLRSAPLGLELPTLRDEATDESGIEDESEVLEERRRGAAEDVPREPSDEYYPRLYWDYGPRFDLLGGKLKLYAGGRLHLDAASFEIDDDVEEAFGEADPGGNFRRGFLEFGGVYEDLDFNLWFNFADVDLIGEEEIDFDAVDFRNVFLGARNLPVVGGFRVGYFKEPFGLEETTSSNDTSFMERSLTDTFIERRNLGAMLHRRFGDEQRVTGAIGVYQDMDDNLESANGYGVTARVTGAPILSDDQRRVLHIGIAGTYRSPDDDTLRFSARPPSAQAQPLADTGRFNATDEFRLGLEFGAISDSFSFQTEAIVAGSDGGSATGDPLFWATYVMASYVLTGEHRSYRGRVGAFGTVQPREPLWRSGIGAFEVGARYGYVDLDSGNIEGGRLHDLTLGLNWYANDNLRVMLNYIVAHPEGLGNEQILQTRLQITL